MNFGYEIPAPHQGEALHAYCQRAFRCPVFALKYNRRPPLALLVKTHRLFESIRKEES